MVRSIQAHQHIKGLCRFFGSIRSTFEVLDGDTLTVTSGSFSGLRFAFEPGLCSVSYGYCSICFDLAGDFTAEALMRLLVNHRIIKDDSWEDRADSCPVLFYRNFEKSGQVWPEIERH